jgi:hypothetical protein
VLAQPELKAFHGPLSPIESQGRPAHPAPLVKPFALPSSEAFEESLISFELTSLVSAELSLLL